MTTTYERNKLKESHSYTVGDKLRLDPSPYMFRYLEWLAERKNKVDIGDKKIENDRPKTFNKQPGYYEFLNT